MTSCIVLTSDPSMYSPPRERLLVSLVGSKTAVSRNISVVSFAVESWTKTEPWFLTVWDTVYRSPVTRVPEHVYPMDAMLWAMDFMGSDRSSTVSNRTARVTFQYPLLYIYIFSLYVPAPSASADGVHEYIYFLHGDLRNTGGRLH